MHFAASVWAHEGHGWHSLPLTLLYLMLTTAYRSLILPSASDTVFGVTEAVCGV